MFKIVFFTIFNLLILTLICTITNKDFKKNISVNQIEYINKFVICEYTNIKIVTLLISDFYIHFKKKYLHINNIYLLKNKKKIIIVKNLKLIKNFVLSFENIKIKSYKFNKKINISKILLSKNNNIFYTFTKIKNKNSYFISNDKNYLNNRMIVKINEYFKYLFIY
ncbi:MAG: hypothetical protein Q8O27_00155 [Enterobacteriaceae bacterium]|nr:hypothetical protein [Enterobacteriaceae bacterium]